MNRKSSKKLCIFGCFEDTELYPRNRILIDVLSSNFENTIEVRPSDQLKSADTHRQKASSLQILHTLYLSVSRFWSLAKQAPAVRSADIVFIPYPAYLDLFFLKFFLLGKVKPCLIVDAFLCLHDTLVNDRKIFKPEGVAAKIALSIESHTLRNADLVFIDTAQQRELLLKSYDLSPDTILATPVGIDETLWTPLAPLPSSKRFRVLFWGTFIPLHGIDTIVRSAEILHKAHPEIELKLIGDGQTGDTIAKQIESLKIDNISWERRLVSGPELRSNVELSHCILGVFGQSDKAGNVIPYKVYQAMASNKIVISREAAAMAEMFHSRIANSGIILVPPNDPEMLASAISNVYQNYNVLCEELKTRELYDSYLSNATLQSYVDEAINSL